MAQKSVSIANKLFSNAHYLTLSTTDGKSPWIAPLYFAHDEKYNFYFISRKDTRHSKHIYKNKKVAFCIFNSEDHSFTAQCVQASGSITEVSTKDALFALKVIFKKKYPTKSEFLKHLPGIKEVTGAINNRIYKITPIHVYILDSSNPDMDTRVEINLNK